MRQARQRIPPAGAHHHAAQVGHVGLDRHGGVLGQLGADVGGVLLGILGARHHHGGAGLQAHALGNAVDLADGVRIDLEPRGQRLDALAVADRNGSPARQPATIGVEVVLECLGVVVRQQDLRVGRAQDDRPVERRVQRLELVDRQVGQPRRQRHVDIARGGDGDEVRVVGDVRQRDAIALRAGDDVLDRLELGHVHARLGGHVQVEVVGRQPGRLVARDRPRHRALAPVVGGQRQLPVAELVVQLGQVVQRGIGRGQHVAALVLENVLPEVVGLAGARDELPHTGRLGAGDRLRVERALHERQQGQFGGHVAPFEFLDDVIQVAVGAVHHAAERLGALGIPVGAVVHGRTLQVGHGETLADARPQVLGRPLEGGHGLLIDIDDRRIFAGRGGNGACAGGVGIRSGARGTGCQKQTEHRCREKSHGSHQVLRGWYQKLPPMVWKAFRRVNPLSPGMGPFTPGKSVA